MRPAASQTKPWCAADCPTPIADLVAGAALGVGRKLRSVDPVGINEAFALRDAFRRTKRRAAASLTATVRRLSPSVSR